MSYKLRGIFGGTFDPIHSGHLGIAQSLLNILPFTEIQLIPCLHPPHRTQPETDPIHRLTMLQLATKNLPKIHINEIELNRKGPSYTIDTLKELSLVYSHDALGLIVGIDVFVQLNQWHQWQSILSFAHLIVVNRPNYHLTPETWLKILLLKHQINEPKELLTQKNGCILFQNITPHLTSASNIRQLRRAGKSIKDQVPGTVEQYIVKHELYL